jgi:hypothetical protein
MFNGRKSFVSNPTLHLKFVLIVNTHDQSLHTSFSETDIYGALMFSHARSHRI